VERSNNKKPPPKRRLAALTTISTNGEGNLLRAAPAQANDAGSAKRTKGWDVVGGHLSRKLGSNGNESADDARSVSLKSSISRNAVPAWRNADTLAFDTSASRTLDHLAHPPKDMEPKPLNRPQLTD
jgi:hypothetical protein